MDEQIRMNNLQKYEISPIEFMQTADLTEGIEGTHVLYYKGRVFTAIVRGSGKVDDRNFGIVRTIRRGFPSKSTTLPVIDHREFAPTFPYASII